jgi:uncharacterized membrane protein YhhN
MNVLIITSVIAALLAIGFMVIRVTRKPVEGMLAKAVASVGFLTIGVAALTVKGTAIPFGAPLIVLGMALGLIGDIVLDLKRAHSEFAGLYLTSGMVSFIAGHIVYLIAILLIAINLYNIDLLLQALVSAGIGVAMGPVTVIVSEKGMKANFGKHRILSGAYGALLIFFTVFTLWLTIINMAFLLMFIGIVLFLLSDLVLSQMYFCEGKSEDKVLVVVNHTLYYAAQIVVGCYLFVLVLP